MTRPGFLRGFARPTAPQSLAIGWGVQPYPPDQVVRPAPSEAVRVATTWSAQSTGGRPGDTFTLTYSGDAPEMDFAAPNTSPAATSPSAMRWYRYEPSSWTPDDPEAGYEVDISGGLAQGRIGMVFNLEIVSGPAAPSSGLTILVGWMDADVNPGSGALIAAGYRWTADGAAGNPAGKAGEVVTVTGNTFYSVPAHDGDRVVAIWTPTGGKVGRVVAWAEATTTAQIVSGLADESGSLNDTVPANWRPVILVGCATTTDNGPHEATVRIQASPFAFYAPQSLGGPPP